MFPEHRPWSTPWQVEGVEPQWRETLVPGQAWVLNLRGGRHWQAWVSLESRAAVTREHIQGGGSESWLVDGQWMDGWTLCMDGWILILGLLVHSELTQ